MVGIWLRHREGCLLAKGMICNMTRQGRTELKPHRPQRIKTFPPGSFQLNIVTAWLLLGMGCEGDRGKCGRVDCAVQPSRRVASRYDRTAFDSLISRAVGSSKLSVPICEMGSFSITQKPLKGKKEGSHLCVPGVVLLVTVSLQLLQLWLVLH